MNSTLVRADLLGPAEMAGTARYLCVGHVSVAASCDAAGPRQVSTGHCVRALPRLVVLDDGKRRTYSFRRNGFSD